MPTLKFFSGKLVLNSVPLDFLEIHLTVILSPLWKLQELHVVYELDCRLHKPHNFGKSSHFVQNKQHTSTLHPFWWLSLQIHSLETCLSLKSQEPLLLEIFFIYVSNAIPKIPLPSPTLLPNLSTTTSWSWHPPVLGHIIFSIPRASSPIDGQLGHPLLHTQLETQALGATGEFILLFDL